jgi:hypothetical protein
MTFDGFDLLSAHRDDATRRGGALLLRVVVASRSELAALRAALDNAVSAAA